MTVTYLRPNVGQVQPGHLVAEVSRLERAWPGLTELYARQLVKALDARHDGFFPEHHWDGKKVAREAEGNILGYVAHCLRAAATEHAWTETERRTASGWLLAHAGAPISAIKPLLDGLIAHFLGTNSLSRYEAHAKNDPHHGQCLEYAGLYAHTFFTTTLKVVVNFYFDQKEK